MCALTLYEGSAAAVLLHCNNVNTIRIWPEKSIRVHTDETWEYKFPYIVRALWLLCGLKKVLYGQTDKERQFLIWQISGWPALSHSTNIMIIFDRLPCIYKFLILSFEIWQLRNRHNICYMVMMVLVRHGIKISTDAPWQRDTYWQEQSPSSLARCSDTGAQFFLDSGRRQGEALFD